MEAIRLSKKMKELEAAGASSAQIRAVADKMKVTSNYDDYVECPHCGRKFNACKLYLFVKYIFRNGRETYPIMCENDK